MKTIGGILLGIFTIIFWQKYYSNLYEYWSSVKSKPDEAMENKAILIKNITIQVLLAGIGLLLIFYTLQLLELTNSR
ncbi:MAG: hypothetical protein FJ139_05925 [Deltaproteobacteria bacterium]|nr:hypothetical protein [Deltaproteobacteria bacterium]